MSFGDRNVCSGGKVLYFEFAFDKLWLERCAANLMSFWVETTSRLEYYKGFAIKYSKRNG